MAAIKPTSSTNFMGIHHLKLASKDILKTLKFYTEILPFKHRADYNHYTPEHKLFAVLFEHDKLLIEARYNPEMAEKSEGWDPITYAVDKRQDLDDWANWLDANNVKRSKVLTGIQGWFLGAEDPDGKIVRFYVLNETHEWTDHPDKDDFWIGKLVADPNAVEEN